MCPSVGASTEIQTKLRPKIRDLLVVMKCCPGDTYKIAGVDVVQGRRCATTSQYFTIKIFGEIRVIYWY